ncbi:MAG: ferrous iron transport protein B [Bacteroidota bacterium]
MKKIALVGNPNSGKTSVFNQLTGLNQQVGNYPGITVDKKTGATRLSATENARIIDLPGTYSIRARSQDERVVSNILLNPEHEDFPDLVVVIVDAANLERNLLLFTQIYDLQVPVILGLNMIDIAERDGLTFDLKKLQTQLGNTPIVRMNARKGQGILELKQAILNYNRSEDFTPFLEKENNKATEAAEEQVKQTQARFQKIKEVVSASVHKETPKNDSFTRKLDRIVVHPVAGYAIFLGILTLIFQVIYSFSEVPMDFIDGVFGSLSYWAKEHLPEGIFVDLLAEGIIPGIGGVVIFIPQIVLLFLFIALLEETGYMARAVFIMDRLMRPFGLNGKSVVPMISGLACAIPAVMATRTISNYKDRLITILVTPLMSCSARLPVYALLIALVIPEETVLGVFDLRGLVLLAMYLLGLVMALFMALIFKWVIKAKQTGFLVMELPRYKVPRWNNVALTLLEKTRLFVFEAGKIILAISIVLWVLGSYGPPERMEKAVAEIQLSKSDPEYEKKVASVKLENSFVGILGKQIEPIIKPLGYDWKIGIALLTSFAAREVFVGSMATIYSVGEDFETDSSLIDRLRDETDPDTGKPIYTLATGLSLMVFYVFAMQCMSTLAIVRRETKSWKWPMIQLVYMTTLAYVAAWVTFRMF